MIPKSPIILGILCVGVLIVSTVGINYSNEFTEFMATTPLQHKLQTDSKVLFEINESAVRHQENNQNEKVDQKRALMKEKITEIARESFGADNITMLEILPAYFPIVKGPHVDMRGNEKTFPICDVAENIPTHLQKINDAEMFQIFFQKYSKYELVLNIQDERSINSSFHYGLQAISDDRKFVASTFFHADSCTNEITDFDKFHLSCLDKQKKEWTGGTTNPDYIRASLELEEFCIIPLSPWHQLVSEYQDTISEKIHEEQEKTIAEEIKSLEDAMKFQSEMEQWVLLSNIAGNIVQDYYEDEKTQDMIREYNEKYGDLPVELLNLLDAKPPFSSTSKPETTKSDSNILVEINQNAMIHQKNNDMDKFHEQVSLMEEKIKSIASDSLGMNVVTVFIDMSDHSTGIEHPNFPFRNSSEIKPTYKDGNTPPIQICNIPEKIPIHLKKIKEKEWFAAFSEKYAKHSTSLDLMDERFTDSLFHYGITVTSEDGLFSASTMFHVNTCNDEIQEDSPFMICRNNSQNEMHQSWNQDDIAASLHLEEFCVIPLDPWRESLHEYGKKIQEKRLEYFDDSFEPETDEEIRRMWDERGRLNDLRGITFLVINNGLESEISQEKIVQYNEKFGDIPEELQELLDAKPL